MASAPLFLPLRRSLLAAAGTGAVCAALSVSAQSERAVATFTPRLGQSGKDVMWLPTPDELVQRLLTMAQLNPRDTLVDLGSGDGKIVIAAARDFGARARGVEYDARMVALSQQRAQEAGLAGRTRFVQGDIFATDFSDATVVAMYLLPELNLRLRPTLMAMRPGTRIVTHQFHLGRWEPDETTLVAHRPGHLWIVPARVAGTWRLDGALPGGVAAGNAARGASGSSDAAAAAAVVDIAFTQSFQKLEGIATLPGLQTTLRAPRLSGTHIAFAFTDAQGRLQEFAGTVAGDRMQGTVAGPRGSRPFTMRRHGEAVAVDGAEPATQEELNAAAASLGSN